MLLQLGIVVALLLGSAFFSSSETALFSLRTLDLQRLKTSSAHRARCIVVLLEHPRRLLTTILIGNTLLNVVLAVLAARLWIAAFGPDRGAALATIGTTVGVLLFGEIVPKSVAVGAPRPLSEILAPGLAAAQRILSPLSGWALRLTDAFSTALERRYPPHGDSLSETELKTLITMGWEQGLVGVREKELIHNVFHLNDRRLKDIVTPRARVFAVDADLLVEDVRDSIALAGYSRVPVYEDDPENLVGYVEVSDLLWGEAGEDRRRVRDLLRPLRYYPETKRVGDLLVEMHRNGEEIAAVVDEHGAFDGIVSLEDALEQVVGEIFDLHDLNRFRFESHGEGEVSVGAQMELEVFNRLLKTHLEDPQAETIGGFVINRLGRIPASGERLRVGDLELLVERAAPNRILTLRVVRHAPAATSGRAR